MRYGIRTSKIIEVWRTSYWHSLNSFFQHINLKSRNPSGTPSPSREQVLLVNILKPKPNGTAYKLCDCANYQGNLIPSGTAWNLCISADSTGYQGETRLETQQELEPNNSDNAGQVIMLNMLDRKIRQKWSMCIPYHVAHVLLNIPCIWLYDCECI